MQPNWFETFFTPLALDFWRAAVPAEATSAEADFLVDALGVAPGAKLLDLPSGSGRHALALAQRGYPVTGIDLAPSGVARAREEASARALPATFVRGDMREPPPGGPYDGAFCFGNSFGYLLHEDMQRFAANMLHAVCPGGRWAIDTGATAESLLPYLAAERTLEAGGVVYHVATRYDALAGRMIQACTLTRGDERQVSEISHGIYTVAELRRLLEGAGWRTVGAYGALDRTPFELGARRLLLVVERGSR